MHHTLKNKSELHYYTFTKTQLWICTMLHRFLLMYGSYVCQTTCPCLIKLGHITAFRIWGPVSIHWLLFYGFRLDKLIYWPVTLAGADSGLKELNGDEKWSIVLCPKAEAWLFVALLDLSLSGLIVFFSNNITRLQEIWTRLNRMKVIN